MSSKVYSNVFSPQEINSIIEFYSSKSIAAEDHYSKNKNLEYQIQDDFSYQLLNTKITEILGEHEFATGAYKECVRPYALHVDAYATHNSTGTITTFATAKKHNAALLIPLVEGPGYKTVTFKCYSDNNKIQLDWLGNTNTLNFAEYQHCHSDIVRLPVDIEYSWHLGDMLVWDRNQLHASADFTRYGVTKKFLILFIA
jgi:hypothetical protein